MKILHLPILLAAGIFLGAADQATAFPRTKESADLTITTTNLADGLYEVQAILKSDTAVPPVPVLIGSITVAGTQPIAPLPLPTTVKALNIENLNVVLPGDTTVDPLATDTIVLTGTPTEDIASWRFFGNRPVTASESFVPAVSYTHLTLPTNREV